MSTNQCRMEQFTMKPTHTSGWYLFTAQGISESYQSMGSVHGHIMSTDLYDKKNFRGPGWDDE